MKSIYAQRHVQHCERLGVYPDSQYGSRPGRSAMDAATVKVLTFETSKVTRNALCLMDNDAVACYDRIITPISSLACQRSGMPKPMEHLHNSILLQTKYHIKTSFGTSKQTYTSTLNSPLQGQGQGSGNAPACWNATSSPMWTALRHLSPLQFTTTTPDKSITTSTQGVAFVDDAINMFNYPLQEPLPNQEQTMEHFSHLVQTWEKLLYSTGGALNPDKCFWYAMLWDYDGIAPRLHNKSELNHHILQLTNSTTGSTHNIAQKDVNNATRTLGVRLSPTGNMTNELQWLTEKAGKFKLMLDRCQLRNREVFIAYTFYYLPRLTYSFPITTLSLRQCNKLQQKITTSFLLAFGFNRNFPRSVAYGPITHGGLDFHHLYSEQGSLRIQHLIGHLRKNTTIGKMHMANLLNHQLISGIYLPLLKHTSQELPYLDFSLLTETRNFLNEVNCTITIPAGAPETYPRDNDTHIMDHFNRASYTKKKLQHLNACRLYLQVITLSNICDGHGSSILPAVMQGTQITSSTTTWAWPRQHRPPEQSWTHWRSALRNCFLLKHAL